MTLLIIIAAVWGVPTWATWGMRLKVGDLPVTSPVARVLVGPCIFWTWAALVLTFVLIYLVAAPVRALLGRRS